jgi:AcrR family transcriptional regulator
MRADARANRERILAAADEVFGAQGTSAATEQIAHLAGVGIATVFRHFPTKTDLVEATLVRHFEALTERAEALRRSDDPGAALAELIRAMVARGATKVSLATMLTDSGGFPVAAAAASRGLRKAVARVLRDAQAAGAARSDVSVDELYLLVRGLSQAAAAQPVPSRTMRGAVEVILKGIAPSA